MAPFSRATGRWCPLLRLQPEFPKEAFHEPERPQLPPVVFLDREPSLLGSPCSCRYILGWQRELE